MLIRCEKCSTLYELDEKLLPPQGAPVQCSKCQFVFKAYPAPAERPAEDSAAVEEPRAELAPRPSPSSGAPDVVREGGLLASERGGGGVAARGSVSSGPLPSPASPGGAMGAAGAPPGAGGDGGEPKFTADGRPIRKVPFPTSEPAPPGSRPVMMRGPERSEARTMVPGRWLVTVAVVLAILVLAALAWRELRARREQQRVPQAGQSLVVPPGAPGAVPGK